MSGKVQQHLRDEHLWCHKEGTYVRGTAFDGDRLLSSGELALLFVSATGREEFLAALRRLNGFFTVVRLSKGVCWLAVDRVRSIPLFYGVRDGDALVSDDCHEVADHLGGGETSEVAKAEFLHLGYVTGSETICPYVKQCRAGEAVFIQVTSGKTTCSARRYYRCSPQLPETHSTEQLASDHKLALQNAFRRLIRWADGRTIVVPLSAGYDSRLVALMLRSIEYPHVITFNYGRLGNKYSEISARVAADLGFDWKFVPYSKRLWAQWYHSEDRVAYQRYCGTLASLPHIQDWPAIRQLTQDGAIPPDSIVVPGHTADFLPSSTSEAVQRLYSGREIDLNLIVDANVQYHYSLWLDQTEKDPTWPRLMERVRQQFEDAISASAEVSPRVLETWNWENYHAKFLINSVRVYDSHRLWWWLPLCDAEYLEFWSRVPLEHRVRRRWYVSFVETMYQQVTGKSGSTVMPMILRCKRFLRRYGLARTIRRLSGRLLGPAAESTNHLLCWHGLIPKSQFDLLYGPGRNINSFLAAEAVGKLTIGNPLLDHAERACR